MALRSAKNSGLDVPTYAITDAIKYLERFYKSKLDEDGNPIDKKSGFAYQPGGHPEYTTTVLVCSPCKYVGTRITFVLGVLDWLLDNAPKTNRKFFFYGTYYYAQSMYQRGDEHADKARKLVEEILLPMQRKMVHGKVEALNQVLEKFIARPWLCWHLPLSINYSAHLPTLKTLV